MNLDEIKTTPREPDDFFIYNNRKYEICLGDFWSWCMSDLIENRNRGILAEYIVKYALGVDSYIRLEWDAYDLKTNEGVKIEVKSAAYIQAWRQNNYSTISFDVAPKKRLLKDGNYSDEAYRQADIYIFCLLHHKDQETIDSTNLNQWTFYLVTTKTLDDHYPGQKTIRLSSIELVDHMKCQYGDLNAYFNKIKCQL